MARQSGVMARDSLTFERISRAALLTALAASLIGGAIFVGIGFFPSTSRHAMEVLAWALMIGGALTNAAAIIFMPMHEEPPRLD